MYTRISLLLISVVCATNGSTRDNVPRLDVLAAQKVASRLVLPLTTRKFQHTINQIGILPQGANAALIDALSGRNPEIDRRAAVIAGNNPAIIGIVFNKTVTDERRTSWGEKRWLRGYDEPSKHKLRFGEATKYGTQYGYLTENQDGSYSEVVMGETIPDVTGLPKSNPDNTTAAPCKLTVCPIAYSKNSAYHHRTWQDEHPIIQGMTAYGRYDGTIEIITKSNYTRSCSEFPAHNGPVNKVSWTNDGSRLFSYCYRDGTVKIWMFNLPLIQNIALAEFNHAKKSASEEYVQSVLDFLPIAFPNEKDSFIRAGMAQQLDRQTKQLNRQKQLQRQQLCQSMHAKRIREATSRRQTQIVAR